MSDVTLDKMARNKNVARAAYRRLSMEQLQKLQDVVSEVMEEKLEEQIRFEEEEAARVKRLEAIRQQLDEAGISPEELLPPQKKRGRPRKNASPTPSETSSEGA